MGGFENYCAVCGLPMRAPFLENDDEPELQPDLQPNQLEWLHDIRLMGENPNAQSLTKIFIARADSYDDLGYYENVTGGDDPNFWSEDDMPGLISALDWDQDHPVIFPFHQACLELLQQKLGPKDLDRAALYEVMRDRYPKEDYSHKLNLDWGELSGFQEQYFYLARGAEFFAIEPTAIPTLAAYYVNLPRLCEQSTASAARGTSKSPQPIADAFSNLSAEITLLVMSHCTMRDAMSLRAASPAALRTVLPCSFWKQQLISDMPWLYDFPEVSASDITTIDWPRAYKELLSASEKNSRNQMLGLVNRRRIWQVTDQFTDAYIRIVREKLMEAIKTGYQPATILQGATSNTSRLLTESEPHPASISSLCFVRDFANTVDHEPVLSVHWNDQGALCGLSSRSSITSKVTQGDGLIGLKKHFKTSEDVFIPKDDWLSGLVTTSRSSGGIRSVVGLKLIFTNQDAVQLGNSDGDQRLFKVAKSKALVGFSGGYAADGRLSKLSLLSQPPTKFPGGVTRIKDKHEKDYNAQCQKHLWVKELPAPGLNVGKPESGYWSFQESRMDLLPTEALVFGRTEEELADMTAISGDVHLGSFEVQYANRPRRTIGPRLRHVKTLPIDGAGGERIAGVYIYTTHITTGIQFVTNRCRQLVIGHPIGGRPSRHPTPPGIFACWEKRSGSRTQMAFAGALSSPGSTNSNNNNNINHLNSTSPPTDSHSFPWEPCYPPDPFVETGPILGHASAVESHGIRQTRIQRRGDVPGDESVVTFLAAIARRPLASMTATLCHGINADYLPLAGLTLRYAAAADDGENEEESGFGPAIRARKEGGEEEEEEEEDDEQCWCALGSRRGEEQQMPHFRLDTWCLQGSPKRLGALRLWLNGNEVGRLAAIQFVAKKSGGDGGQEEEVAVGPIWGYGKEGEYDETVTIGDGEEEGVNGLKFFLGDNDRAVTYDDAVVNAIQGLGRRSGSDLSVV